MGAAALAPRAQQAPQTQQAQELNSGCAAQVLAATQTPGTGGSEWFQGTADAVRQYSWLFSDVKNKDVEDVLILSGA